MTGMEKIASLRSRWDTSGMLRKDIPLLIAMTNGYLVVTRGNCVLLRDHLARN